MIYIINCPCCGLQISSKAPSGSLPESSFAGVCNSLLNKRGLAWASLDTDLKGLSGLLCDSESLGALGVSDDEQSSVELLYELTESMLASDPEQ